MEGADVTIAYKPEEETDAMDAVEMINSKTKKSRKITTAPLDLRKEKNCKKLVDIHLKEHGTLDSLSVVFRVQF